MTTGWLAPLAPPGAHHRRSSLSLAAWTLLALWCLLGFAVGVYRFANAPIETGRGIVPASILHRSPGIGFALLVVWLISFNIAGAGLIMGIISTARRPNGRLRRSLAFSVIVVAGGMAQLWVLSLGDASRLGSGGFVADGRLGGLVTCLCAVSVAGGTAALLGVRTRSSAFGLALATERSEPASDGRSDTVVQQ